MSVSGAKGTSVKTGLPATQSQKNSVAPTNSQPPAGSVNPKGMKSVGTGSEQKTISMLMSPAQIQKLDANISAIRKFVNQTYLEGLSNCTTVELEEQFAHRDQIYGFEITRLMLGQKENNHEKLVSLYAAMRRMTPEGIALVLDSNDGITHIYLCIKGGGNKTNYEALKRNFLGQFPGSEVLEDDDKEDASSIRSVLNRLGYCPEEGRKYIQTLSVSPSRREAEQKDTSLLASAQGMEKFIDAMTGSRYTVMMLATPVIDSVMEMRKQGLELSLIHI